MPLTGCASNAATFYEGTRFAFVIEFKPESSQPMNLSLGYKRRIAAVVPPQKPAPKTPAQNQDQIHEGDALSLVSTFDVEGAGIGKCLPVQVLVGDCIRDSVTQIRCKLAGL